MAKMAKQMKKKVSARTCKGDSSEEGRQGERGGKEGKRDVVRAGVVKSRDFTW